jgi:hypothetical protein
LKGKIQKIKNGAEIQFFHENEEEKEKIADFCYQSRVEKTKIMIVKGYGKNNKIEINENQNNFNVKIKENKECLIISIRSESHKKELDLLFRKSEPIIMVAKTSTALTAKIIE